MRLHRIALALSSRTIARTERYTDDSAPFIPISVPASSYPIRINRNLPFYTQSSSSLTRLERTAKVSLAPGYAGARRKRVKHIPFLRSNTSSTLSLRVTTSSGSDLTPSPEINQSLINETVRSIRTILTPEDAKKESSKNRLSKQIKHLRRKFDSVGEESHFITKFDHDSDTSFAMNSEKEKNLKETKTTGGIMAALLIGSIQTMPLETIGTTDPVSIVSSRPNEEEKREIRCTENSNSNVQGEEQRQDIASLIDETEMSSCNDDNSTGDELSEDTTSYNVLDDSRYSVDGDSDKAESSSSLQERIPITRSSAESCTDSTLQIESDVATNHSPSNPNLASMKDIVSRNDTIPIITVDTQESTDSDVSIDTSGFSNSESRPNITNSYVLTETNIFAPKLTHSSDKREIDDVRQASDTSGTDCQTLNLEEDKRRATSESSISETHRVHPTKHERDLCRERSQSAHRQSKELESPTKGSENRMNADKERNDPVISLPHVTTRSSLSNEEARALATIERRRCMRDLIKLIDTKMMVSTRATRHSKRTVSMRNKRRRHERKASYKGSKKSGNFDKFPSRGASARKRTSHRRREKDVLRVPRVRSIPECLSSDHHPVFYVTSRSCGSSLVSLTDCTRVSPSPAFHRPHDGSSKTSGKLPRSGRGKPDAVPAISISSVCNLEKTSCHIDCAMPTNNANMTYNSRVSRPSPDLRQQDETSVSPSCPLPTVPTVAAKMSQSPATRTLANVPLHRRSSDSDLSVTPKGIEIFLQAKNEINSRKNYTMIIISWSKQDCLFYFRLCFMGNKL